jgi:hypothetical protein
MMKGPKKGLKVGLSKAQIGNNGIVVWRKEEE